ncbi:c-type cytochrome [Echinicola jeungdonensis]|uniref:C-type cytochrome n=1 Tax=Echinicola jeungdonensis TaxID=709343 RepID=A0ABV5J574_9BACT|nr:c-type cytochrome [Echinicola jeungdonensis]MDN3669618.1 c-type cytochrome [Echinicola jeungdonensis]
MKFNRTLMISIIAISGLAYACGGSGEKKETEETQTTQETQQEEEGPNLEENPAYVEGLALVKGSDCTTCHLVERKVVGPAYNDVAEKYEDTEENIELLAGRVIAGSVGHWGEVPMPEHPGLTDEEAKKMVKYILLLK